jgi:hypothetical protein
MSTKTNFKRIALVAVAALGAGVLSVAPANASLVAGDITITSTVATTTAGIGICVVSADESATITTAASLIFTKTNGNAGYVVIESGTAVFSAASQGAISTNQKKVTVAAGDTSAALTLKASAVGSVRVVAYNSSDVAVESYAITVVAACARDAYAADKSFVQGTASGGTATSNVDASGSLDVTNAPVYISVALNDAYGVDLATAGALTATVTGAATAGIGGSGASATAVKATVVSAEYIRIDQATAGAPATGTVTIQFNGVTIGSKAYTIRGVATSITVSAASLTVGKTGTTANGVGAGVGTTGAGYYEFQYKDASGNVVTNGAGPNSGNNAASSTTGLNTVVTAVNSVVMPSSATTATTNFGKGEWTCGSNGGSATIVVAAKNSNLETIKSDPFTATCGNVLDTWTISLDKASYAPGEIATLTLTGKDSRGNNVNSFETIGTVEASFGGLTAVTAPTSTDKFTSAAGVKTYKYAVGMSEGSFVGTFKITGTTDKSAKTIQYKVAGAAGVSNADVLKAIVSLIASINKQIALLQKALLKK